MHKISYNDEGNIIHVTYMPEAGEDKYSDPVPFKRDGRVVLSQTEVSFTKKDLVSYVCDGEPVIRKKMTANGEVSYVENMQTKVSGTSYSATLTFEAGPEDLLFGLGQYEEGITDRRDTILYLYQSNMRIAIPYLMSNAGYAILIDSESDMIYESRGCEVKFTIDTAASLSYHVFLADDMAGLVKLLYKVTGLPSMLPRWAFGYIQSKERYRSAKELTDTADTFSSLSIPIDCIVQDWYSWDEGMWGNKTFDRNRYPDLLSTVKKLHDTGIHFMVSIWPNMSPGCRDHEEFARKGWLLPNSNVYDAFNEDARSLYWDQCMRQIMASGTDALWCDNSEPFSDADWSGDTKKSEEDRYLVVTDMSRMSMDWDRLNSYALYHAKGIYENWRRDLPQKRVVNLTRSGYTGSWRYGTILWSGDITARFDTMKKQIGEAINASLSGIPYWTLDIGGFFVVNDKYENRGCNDTDHKPLWFWHGDYNDGVGDPAYRELYTRWLQFGAFLPVFRSHGTDTPREPWQFGKEGDMFYDTIVSFIRLRYQLMPYIYSLAASAHMKGDLMVRALVMDFPEDREARLINDEYMFGPSFLVAPVTEHMYYMPGGEPIHDKEKKRRVYLPEGCGWFDLYTEEYHEGGTFIEADAPIDRMPLYVRAGSIIPMAAKKEYLNSEDLTADTLLVYEGADCSFDLYSDEGDGYGYEEGLYDLTRISYTESSHSLITDGSKNLSDLFLIRHISRGQESL